jgi:hypothetical protein
LSIRQTEEKNEHVERVEIDEVKAAPVRKGTEEVLHPFQQQKLSSNIKQSVKLIKRSGKVVPLAFS